MQRINIYIPEDLNQNFTLVSKHQQRTKAEVIREAMEKGLKSIQPKDNSAQALLELARLAEKLPYDPNMPKDLSTNHDFYLWGGKKRKE